MNKKLIIGIIVVAVAWGGLMIYRSKGKSEDTAHKAANAERIVSMAQKDARAGMSKVGMALNKYYETHNAYPEKLADRCGAAARVTLPARP